MRVLVSGGSGFIGSALVLHLVQDLGFEVLNIDAMTYAANPLSLESMSTNSHYRFALADICETDRMTSLVRDFSPDAVMHLAAESHVDRSISGPEAFVRANVGGTLSMLEAARSYWVRLPASQSNRFRFIHVSTDEVYGSLGPDGHFSEETRYDPRSPYAATKAASDHLAKAWHETYGLPVIVSNCSNNYGPRQFPEKLIPLMILSALEGLPLPVYGDGENRRDWIHVEDHARALVAILQQGRVGDTYLVGARSEKSNLEVVKALCRAFDDIRPLSSPHDRMITFVPDRPGHDRRYAIDPSKVERETSWRPRHVFEVSLKETVRWYLDNAGWWEPIRAKIYQGQRLGLGGGS